MKIIRKWKDGRQDIFTIEDLQEKIHPPTLSKQFEPKKYCHLKIHGKKLYNYNFEKDLPDEIFKYIEDKGISVSNFARIKYNNKIVPQYERRNNQITNGNKKVCLLISIINILGIFIL